MMALASHVVGRDVTAVAFGQQADVCTLLRGVQLVLALESSVDVVGAGSHVLGGERLF